VKPAINSEKVSCNARSTFMRTRAGQSLQMMSNLRLHRPNQVHVPGDTKDLFLANFMSSRIEMPYSRGSSSSE